MFTSWIGIGAQRSGTTWFTDLLLQHPDVALAGQRKELHAFDAALVTGWTDQDTAQYRQMFDKGTNVRAGEFTPSYLRCPWIPDLIATAAPPNTLFLVLLRDPVKRFESAMRWYASRPNVPDREKADAFGHFVRMHGSDATWAGMYGDQLDLWARRVGRGRMLVLQYEACLRDPEGAIGLVCASLGIQPVEPLSTGQPSNTTSSGQFALPPADRALLMELYRPGVQRLQAEWDIDASLWCQEDPWHESLV